MNKKILMPVGIVLCIGLVFALSYYAIANINLNITQPISVSGDLSQSVPCDSGETCLGNMIRVDNSADSEKTIAITDNSITDIEVNYVGRLELDNKDTSTWTRISDAMEGELYYFIVGDEFRYHLEAEGLNANTEYALIYYLDSGATDPILGKPFNLDNAVEIERLTSDGSGNLLMEGSELVGDLPFSTDYNSNPNQGDSYCNGENGYDFYQHCSGAKVWLITGNLELSNWNPNEWLFESDLINYYQNSNGEYVIGGDSFVEFYPLFEISKYLPTGQYSVDINIA